MISVFESQKSTIKFHNNDVRIVRPIDKGAREAAAADDIIRDSIGEVYDNGTIFLDRYDGNYILFYEDEFGNIIDECDPIVNLRYEQEPEEGVDSYSADFADNMI
jgi:hypothetical protein